MRNYQFTNKWFDSAARATWDQLIPQLNPMRILEIGSYEGASACYLIDALASKFELEIHCIDTWEGGLEHKPDGSAPADMSAVENRFRSNMQQAILSAKNKVDLVVHKGQCDLHLPALIAAGKAGYFDFIYVDGSHQAPDVLTDAVLCFKLLRKNGILAFDDYLWNEPLAYGVDPIRSPKMAIDAFTNIYCRKLRVLSAPLYQLYVQKTSD